AAFLFERRWPQGFVCPACGEGRAAFLKSRAHTYECLDCGRQPLEGVVEVDQTEIPFRADNSFFDPVKSGKILIAGAVEVIDRATNQAKPRQKRAKYLDTRSGRIRLAAIPDNSAASIEAFVRANVKSGTTLLTDGHRSYPGLISHHPPTSYWDIVGRDNPRKGVPTVRRQPRRRRTATGMRADRSRPPEKLEPSSVSGSTRQP